MEKQECIVCGKERTAWVWPEGSEAAPIPICSHCYAGVDAVIGAITEHEQPVRLIFPRKTKTETQTKAVR